MKWIIYIKKNNRKPSGAQNTPSSKTPEIKIEKKIVKDEQGRLIERDILDLGYGAQFPKYMLSSTQVSSQARVTASTPLPQLNTSGAGANQSQNNTNHTTGANQSRDNTNRGAVANQSRNNTNRGAVANHSRNNTNRGAGANQSRNNTNRGAVANHSWHNANHTTGANQSRNNTNRGAGANQSRNNTNPEPASTQPQPLPVLAADANHSRDNTNPASASTQGPPQARVTGLTRLQPLNPPGAGANQSRDNTNSEPAPTQPQPLPVLAADANQSLNNANPAPVPTPRSDTDAPMDEQEAIDNLKTNTTNTSNIIKLERFFDYINGWNKNSNIKNIRTLEDLLKLMYMHKISDFTDEEDMCAFIDMYKKSDIRKIGDISEIIKKKLTVNEIRSFSAYVGKSYEYINNYLRFDNTDEGVIKDYVDNMKSAFTKAPRLMGDITVYRGCTKCVIDNELIDFTTDIDKEKIRKWIGNNAIISDKGFMSTSVKKEVATFHCKDGGALLRIKVPKGTPAFHVTKELENRSFSEDLRHESEIVFGVNQRIKINNIEKPGDYYVIDGELQMQDGGAAQQKRRTSAPG